MDPESAFAWINMQRQVDSNLFLLVEGEDEDAILYGHVDPCQVTLLVLRGKPNVLATCRLLEERSTRGVFSLIDRDLDDLTGLSGTYPPNLAASAGYDLVTDIVMARPEILAALSTYMVGRLQV